MEPCLKTRKLPLPPTSCAPAMTPVMVMSGMGTSPHWYRGQYLQALSPQLCAPHTEAVCWMFTLWILEIPRSQSYLLSSILLSDCVLKRLLVWIHDRFLGHQTNNTGNSRSKLQHPNLKCVFRPEPQHTGEGPCLLCCQLRFNPRHHLGLPQTLPGVIPKCRTRSKPFMSSTGYGPCIFSGSKRQAGGRREILVEGRWRWQWDWCWVLPKLNY